MSLLSVKGGICAFEKSVQKGKAVVIGTEYICHIEATETLMRHLGAEHALSHDYLYGGILMNMSKAQDSEARFLHVLNMDTFAKTTQFYYNGEALFGGRQMYLGSRDGYMLPMNVNVLNYVIVSSTAEIYMVQENEIMFRLTQPQDEIILEGIVSVEDSDTYGVEIRDGNTHIYSNSDGRMEEFLAVRFK